MERRKMLVVITGGRGRIGTVIQEVLKQRGISYRTLGRSSPAYNDPRHITGSTIDPEVIERLVDGATVLIHLARTTHQVEDMCRFDYPALAPIMGAVVAHNLEIHFTSTQMVHDCARTYPLDVIDENFPFEPYDPYGAMKLAWERTLICYKKTHSVNYITYRFPTVVEAKLQVGAGLGQYLKQGIEQGCVAPTNDNDRFGGQSIIHVEQVAEVIVNNMGNTHAFGREYHVCCSDYLRNCDLAVLSVEVLQEHGVKVCLDWDMTGVPGPEFITMQAFSNTRARRYLDFKADNGAVLLGDKLRHAVRLYLTGKTN